MVSSLITITKSQLIIYSLAAREGRIWSDCGGREAYLQKK